MRFAQPIKEKVARIIADYFTTAKIVSVFTDMNVPTDVALYAKWRITLDAFNKMSSPEEAIPAALENFAHPLNFGDPDLRKQFVKQINKVLGYAGLEIHATEFKSQMLDQHGFPVIAEEVDATPHKTPADYVKEVISFFKDEYNKALVAGLTYEFCLGEAADMDGRYSDAYLGRQKAVEQLKRIGFITELVHEQQMSNDNEVYDIAMCKIDESKLTQKEEPKATAAGAEAIAQKVIHEHTHRFENNDSVSPFKMEITKIPELQVRNVEDTSIVKGKKRVHLPKFNETEWSKVVLHFTDEWGVVITAGKKQAPSDYKALGFADDKRDRPNKAWGFLLALARSGGATPTLPKPIPDDYKQLKKQVSDRLKVIFKNETDPFYAVGDTGVYRIKIALKPPHTDAAKPDKLGIQEYLKDTMTEEYEE